MKKKLIAILTAAVIILASVPMLFAFGGTELPIVVFDDISPKFIDNNAGVYSVTDKYGANTEYVLIMGTSSDSCTITEDYSDLIVLVDNVKVKIGTGGDIGEYKLSGLASLKIGNETVSTGSYITPYQGDKTNADKILEFYNSDDIKNALYSYTYATNKEITGDFKAHKIDAKKNLTLDGKTETSILSVGGKLIAKDDITVKEGGVLILLGEVQSTDGVKLTVGKDVEVLEGTPIYTYNSAEKKYDILTLSDTHDEIVFTYTTDKDFSGFVGEVALLILGDVNEDGSVTSDDAIYLLHYTFEPDDYPLYPNHPTYQFPHSLAAGDINGDQAVTSDDAIYLLHFTFEPEDYPLYPEK